MKELKTYISEGFFTNIGANNRINQAIDTIKDASLNDKIDSSDERRKFADSLAVILKDIENEEKDFVKYLDNINDNVIISGFKNEITSSIRVFIAKYNLDLIVNGDEYTVATMVEQLDLEPKKKPIAAIVKALDLKYNQE